MNTLELLLKADTDQFKLPIRKVEIPRLSALFGGQAVFTCQALSPSKYNEIQEAAADFTNSQIQGIDMGEVQMATVLAGVIEPNLKDKELMAHFKVPTPAELVKKLLLPGEIVMIFNVISEISGFGDDVIKEIKN
ncbi:MULTISPECIES: XkdN-like protein [unclassified Dehalobacter]|uniref:phage tail assembly chaperone n=1 Tax=unclassified Dehalobacter TaxID=2635733 RepID=UPI000E6B88D0|nr:MULTISPECIES: XkdN-like protein [unclassified Dehalobacter]RJE48692.1 hypothetical protein A7K50_10195 [Dehalobacter sp. MCB1]TCX53393.1 XkdN-like protein [Dehalobacter sp. 14DCB1]TCX54408.1 XkdN-like protein [Dehalobacter sp. 12DCB1]